MQARNAAGCQVSLLNDEVLAMPQYPPARPISFHAASHVLSRPYPGSRSSSSSPMTPELLRSDSYDSQMSNDAISPLTPSVDYAYPRSALYSSSMDGGPPAKRPAYVDSSRSTPFDDDGAAVATMPEQRPSKRYPCRYRDSHGCEKTFTTSGHASRHSKIHTAEKAVQCTYPGCQKKFTRADNMKQHLETHFKDKGQSAGASRAHKAALAEASRTSAATVREGGRSGTPRTSTITMAPPPAPQNHHHHHHHHHHLHHHSHSHRRRQMHTSPLPSPTGSASWDMRSMNLPLLSRPVAARSHSNGLDALAMAVACQEGGS